MRSHVAQASREPLLNRLADFLTSKGFPCKVEVPPCQPLTLDLWRTLLLFCDDISREGAHRHFGRCSAFRGCAHEGVELGILEEPCGSALEDPDCLMRLQQADVEAGFADWIAGGVEEARRLFGANCAAGKLGFVKKENSEPGLVGDSSISCANELFRIREKIELPSLFDIEEFVSRHPRDKWIAFSLDVAKAHKRIRVHPSEQGFSLFCAVDSAGQSLSLRRRLVGILVVKSRRSLCEKRAPAPSWGPFSQTHDCPCGSAFSRGSPFEVIHD